MNTPVPSMQDWQSIDSLDALIAAPDHHKLLFENERVRVLFTSIPAGDKVPVHTHRWPSVLYIQSWGEFVRCDENGKVLLDSRTAEAFKTPSEVLWSQPLPPHTLENVGSTSIDIIAVELKDN
jgi:hypothetical protein